MTGNRFFTVESPLALPSVVIGHHHVCFKFRVTYLPVQAHSQLIQLKLDYKFKARNLMEGFQMYATRECSMLFQELHEKKGSVRSILGIFN